MGRITCNVCGARMVSVPYKAVHRRDHPWGFTIWKSVPQHASFNDAMKCAVMQYDPNAESWIMNRDQNTIFDEEFEIPEQVLESFEPTTETE